MERTEALNDNAPASTAQLPPHIELAAEVLCTVNYFVQQMEPVVGAVLAAVKKCEGIDLTGLPDDVREAHQDVLNHAATLKTAFSTAEALAAAAIAMIVAEEVTETEMRDLGDAHRSFITLVVLAGSECPTSVN